MSTTNVPRLTLGLLVVFVLSGFAGLIYQSVWTQYLGLTLGHAAYAQTLVLAIFMGGMAAGAWLASLYSVRWKRLILGYAVVELVIGVFGLVFHPMFVSYTGFSQDTVLPAMDSVVLARGYQWLSAALMITPQSILLGATFPLMSAGLIRALPNQHGEVLGGLYFTNSLGAAIGALVSTFVLLPAVGLPGTVLTAAVLNIVVAILAWGLAKSLREETFAAVPEPVAETKGAGEDGGDDVRKLGRVLVWSTAISGAASFVYEVGWVRLLNQAFGTTIHSFELMLAAFILGLAFGGLWVRKRAKSILEPVRYVGYVQVWMAVAALLSIPVFTQSFTWVGWIMSALARTDSGYILYELATAAISLLVMFPAAFLAGMTLPLFTLALMRAGAGERSIGRIYAANTVGAIVGVAMTMHLLIPVMGVRLAVTVGALLDGLVGLYLLRVLNPARLTAGVGAVAFALVAATGLSVVIGKPDPVMQASGVFRTGIAKIDAEVAYLRDGKTATVSVFKMGATNVIATNGKPDAGLRTLADPPSGDEITMVALGAAPLMLHPDPRRIAVIGWGSGLSTHTLLGSGVPESVDTIEIERAMVDGARLFGERNRRAYEDPRSHMRIDDARTFFSTGGRKYDVIVSEPSNPWVSGVSSLFTQEFYGFLGNHLEDDGLLVQWLHLYEIDEKLVGTMLAALAAEFPAVDVYMANESDMILVARKKPGPLAIRHVPEASDALKAELRRVNFDMPEQLQIRHLGGMDVLRNYLRLLDARPHSDFFPVVSLQAPRTRFRHDEAKFLPTLVTPRFPVLDVLACRQAIPLSTRLPDDASWLAAGQRNVAWAVIAALDQSIPAPDTAVPVEVTEALAMIQLLGSRPHPSPEAVTQITNSLATIAGMSIAPLSSVELSAWQQPDWVPEPARADPVIAAQLEAYAAMARRDAAGMHAAALRALEGVREGKLSTTVVEHLVIVAMLGAIGDGRSELALEVDEDWWRVLPKNGVLSSLRRFLETWARSEAPACAVEDGA